jgi:ferritin
MISEKVEAALNKQIGAELFSAHLYMSMATYFDSIHLRGCAKWMRLQHSEEQEHALKLYRYIDERGGRVKLGGIDAPPTDWASPLAAFQASYEHECKISAMINDLVTLTDKEGDTATNNFLAWFVEEQVEEEAQVREIVEQMKMIGDSKNGLFMINIHLGRRGEK